VLVLGSEPGDSGIDPVVTSLAGSIKGKVKRKIIPTAGNCLGFQPRSVSKGCFDRGHTIRFRSASWAMDPEVRVFSLSVFHRG